MFNMILQLWGVFKQPAQLTDRLSVWILIGLQSSWLPELQAINWFIDWLIIANQYNGNRHVFEECPQLTTAWSDGLIHRLRDLSSQSTLRL